jgi:hypothetical protein
MGARAARAGVTLRRVEALTDISNLVAQAARQHATDYEYLSELATWSGRYGSKAGVPAGNTPESDPTAALPGRVFAEQPFAQPPDADRLTTMHCGGTGQATIIGWRVCAGGAASLVLPGDSIGPRSCPITEPLEVAQTGRRREQLFSAPAITRRFCFVSVGPVNADPLQNRRGTMSES